MAAASTATRSALVSTQNCLKAASKGGSAALAKCGRMASEPLVKTTATHRIYATEPRRARQTFSGVAGISNSLTPSASVTAFITAAGAAMAPASPQPFTPKGLDGQAVIVMPTE